MTTTVKYPLAKLLKEKGFDNHCDKKYIAQCLWQKPNSREKYKNSEIHQNCSDVSAPTIAEVVMWLYEKHGIWIDVSLNQFSKSKDLQWMYSIVFTEDCTYSHSPKSYISPTEAYEAAIEYVLTHLI